jgi:hypothetical protein
MKTTKIKKENAVFKTPHFPFLFNLPLSLKFYQLSTHNTSLSTPVSPFSTPISPLSTA